MGEIKKNLARIRKNPKKYEGVQGRREENAEEYERIRKETKILDNSRESEII